MEKKSSGEGEKSKYKNKYSNNQKEEVFAFK
jgi:hypothetical protein